MLAKSCFISFCIRIVIVVILESLFSQGSVATKIRCGRIFSNRFIKIFLRMCRWKNLKMVNIWWRCGQKFAVYFFGTPCGNNGIWTLLSLKCWIFRHLAMSPESYVDFYNFKCISGDVARLQCTQMHTIAVKWSFPSHNTPNSMSAGDLTRELTLFPTPLAGFKGAASRQEWRKGL